MSTFAFWLMLVVMLLVVPLVPLYAHHGNQFLSKAMEMNLAVVRFAEMAANKTQNPRIKEFAQTVVKEDNEALDKIRNLRDGRLAYSINPDKGVDRNTAKAVADIELSTEHQRTADRLSALTGPDFDRAFIDVTVRDHRLAIRDFEAQTHVHGNGKSSNNQSTAKSGQETTLEKPSTPDQQQYSIQDLRHDVDTADFANATLPALRHHLEQAEEIQQQLEGQ